MNREDIDILDDLKTRGSITDEEYQREKARVLNEAATPALATLWGMDEKTYVVLMHLSQFVSTFLIPLIMWLANNQNKAVDQNGKNILNFTISYAIYAAASGILVLLLIGIPLLVALGVLTFLFIIIAAVKAANGETWKYPLSIEFIK